MDSQLHCGRRCFIGPANGGEVGSGAAFASRIVWRASRKALFAGELVAHHLACALVHVAGFEPHAGTFADVCDHGFERKICGRSPMTPCQTTTSASPTVRRSFAATAVRDVDNPVAVHCDISNRRVDA